MSRISLQQTHFWLLQIGGWFGYGLLMSLGSLSYHNSFWGAASYKFTIVAMGLPLTTAMRYLYRSKWFNRHDLLWMTVVGIFLSFIASNLTWVVVNLTWKADEIVTVSRLFKGGLTSTPLFVAWTMLYLGIRHHLAYQESRTATLAAEALAHEARLSMLRYQLNPHFLFNALNSVNALISREPQKAELMTTELSSFLRYTLAQQQRDMVSLREEIQAVENYLNIEKIRYEEKLCVNYQIDEHTFGAQLPSFLIHPLVENAVKYGMRSSELPLKLEISAQAHGKDMTLIVANSGTWAPEENNPFSKESSTGIGLKNIRDRLAAYFPGNHQFDIREQDGMVEARLELGGVL